MGFRLRDKDSRLMVTMGAGGAQVKGIREYTLLIIE